MHYQPGPLLYWVTSKPKLDTEDSFPILMLHLENVLIENLHIYKRLHHVLDEVSTEEHVSSIDDIERIRKEIFVSSHRGNANKFYGNFISPSKLIKDATERYKIKKQNYPKLVNYYLIYEGVTVMDCAFCAVEGGYVINPKIEKGAYARKLILKTNLDTITFRM